MLCPQFFTQRSANFSMSVCYSAATFLYKALKSHYSRSLMISFMQAPKLDGQTWCVDALLLLSGIWQVLYLSVLIFYTCAWEKYAWIDRFLFMSKVLMCLNCTNMLCIWQLYIGINMYVHMKINCGKWFPQFPSNLWARWLWKIAWCLKPVFCYDKIKKIL